MGDGYLTTPLEFIVRTLVGMYILTVMLRFLFGLVRADFYNPVSQFIVRLTNPPLRVLRRLIPGWRNVDTASIVLMLGLQMLVFAVLVLLRGGEAAPLALLFASLAELLQLAINVFFFSIIIQAILSWVNPQTYNPMVGLLHSLNGPLLRPARKLLPPISGVDLSSILVLMGLKVLEMLLVPPLLSLA